MMTKTQEAVAQHLAHSKPSPIIERSADDRFAHAVTQAIHVEKVKQWEVDVLMVMDALSMGVSAGKSFDRGEFLRKIDRQFQEDEACRSGSPPVGVDDPTKVSSSST